MRVSVRKEVWAIRPPLRIARGVMDDLGLIVVELFDGEGQRGRGEAVGVPYVGETPDSMIADIEAVRPEIEAGASRVRLQSLLGPGGARNALDCALWDLEAKASGVPAWRRAGLSAPRAVVTAFTIGLASAQEVRARARASASLPLLKVKLDAADPVQTVSLVRSEAPSARIIVDANQAWSPRLLNEITPALHDLGVELIEQPVACGQDEGLADYGGPIPLAADESCVDLASVDRLRPYYQFVNIKLDKSGGLTEALEIAVRARALGLGVMIGCMAGTSLSMAPAAIVANLADIADLDGPLLHGADRENGLTYDAGVMTFPAPALWG